jgi:hypothetical protein
LPKPDALGRVRPYVGRDQKGKPVKFQVGSIKDTPQQEMQRRLDNIRLLYQCSCREYGIDYLARVRRNNGHKPRRSSMDMDNRWLLAETAPPLGEDCHPSAIR